jgi:hypothetical protein
LRLSPSEDPLFATSTRLSTLRAMLPGRRLPVGRPSRDHRDDR